MREGTFIKQNIDRWKSYDEPTSDPDEVAKRFTYLVDDLAYAKTFYPFSATARYVNGLAAKIYLTIYKHRRDSTNRFVAFWTTELPLVMRRSHRTLLIAFVFFLLFWLLGAFSASQDQSVIRAILGDEYVDRTERNIALGNPFGVYKKMEPAFMFLYIAWNNLTVAFIFFAGGILLSVGTLFKLFQTGVMVGAFEYLFYQHGLGAEFFLVVFIHGTLELAAFVIAATAGLRMGNAMLFPGTFTRLQSLKAGAKDGAKIMVALIPILLVAAFFESYVTRHTNMPLPMSLLILFGSAAFMVWYFVLYPLRVARARGIVHPLSEGIAE